MDDPLNINIPLAGHDTSYPLIPEGDYVLQINGNKLGPSYDKTVLCWEPQFVTTTPIAAVEPGRTIPVNSKVFIQWPIDLAEKPDTKAPGAWFNTLCLTIDAIFGTDKTNRPEFNRALVETTVGKTVLGHIIIDTDKQGVSRNKVARLKKVA